MFVGSAVEQIFCSKVIEVRGEFFQKGGFSSSKLT
jgi:hypothetical protein